MDENKTIDWYWSLTNELQLDLQHNHGNFRNERAVFNEETLEFELPENYLIWQDTIEITSGYYHVYLSKLDNKYYRSSEDAAKLYGCDIGGLEELEQCFKSLFLDTENNHDGLLSDTNFIADVEKLTSDIIKVFPKFFDDFENWEYETGTDAGKDFKRIFKKAKKLDSILKNKN